MTPGETLRFLDEIQACPPALAMLRYFFELMPDLHVIAAGLLLIEDLGTSKDLSGIYRVANLNLDTVDTLADCSVARAC